MTTAAGRDAPCLGYFTCLSVTNVLSKDKGWITTVTGTSCPATHTFMHLHGALLWTCTGGLPTHAQLRSALHAAQVYLQRAYEAYHGHEPAARAPPIPTAVVRAPVHKPPHLTGTLSRL